MPSCWREDQQTLKNSNKYPTYRPPPSSRQSAGCSADEQESFLSAPQGFYFIILFLLVLENWKGLTKTFDTRFLWWFVICWVLWSLKRLKKIQKCQLFPQNIPGFFSPPPRTHIVSSQQDISLRCQGEISGSCIDIHPSLGSMKGKSFTGGETRHRRLLTPFVTPPSTPLTPPPNPTQPNLVSTSFFFLLLLSQEEEMDVQGRIFEVGLMKAAPSPSLRAQQQVGCSVGLCLPVSA